jgi:hypothetical protein
MARTRTDYTKNRWAAAHRRPKIERPTVVDFRNDRLFPRIERAVAAILAEGNVVAPVEVLVRLEKLTAKQLDDWRRGRIPYLERVIRGNLTQLSRLLRILRFHAHDLCLVPSQTAYLKWGKGRRTPLRFSKTGDPRVEQAYARHFVWPGKGPFHAPGAKRPSAELPIASSETTLDDRAADHASR